MKYSVLISLILGSQCVMAQGHVTVKNGTISSRSNYSSMISYYNVKGGDVIILNDDVIGSPFLNDTYEPGSIFIGEDVAVESIFLKYNAYNDSFLAKMEINDEDSEARGVSKVSNLGIKMGSRFFVALPSTENRYDLQYYQLLLKGEKISFLKKHMKSYKERVRATTSLTRDVPATFKDKTAFFVMDATGNFSELPSSKKKIVELMQDQKKEVENCIITNNLNVKSEEDLIRLFRFYNNLER